MIQNDQELRVTQERIVRFESLLAQLRVSASREEFPQVSGGYRREIERMHTEVMEYLTRHSSDAPLAIQR
ncbi:hypothetical protein [Armatimonas rosea]|uniref:Uncharacterized protein n=1 Tax=Armatimonas rosea TaxID=685828 RepID=A0A7W9SQ59_ARMRO|nr:hypothetical protein [Armatimonas rosea]MBB6050153.1 hypothetical protein [Armatimonas rosea]